MKILRSGHYFVVGGSQFSQCGQTDHIMRDEGGNLILLVKAVSLRMGGGRVTACLSAAGRMNDPCSTAPLPLPPWYFPAAKCHIHIPCQLINLSAPGERGAILGPVRLWISASRQSLLGGATSSLSRVRLPRLLKFERLGTQKLDENNSHNGEPERSRGHHFRAEGRMWWMPRVWGGWH